MLKTLAEPRFIILTLILQLVLVYFCSVYEKLPLEFLRPIPFSLLNIIWVLIPGFTSIFIKQKTVKNICLYSFYTASIINLGIIFFTISKLLSLTVEQRSNMYFGKHPSLLIFGFVLFYGWVQVIFGALIGTITVLIQKRLNKKQ